MGSSALNVRCIGVGVTDIQFNSGSGNASRASVQIGRVVADVHRDHDAGLRLESVTL
jgi:hypothetical protein